MVTLYTDVASAQEPPQGTERRQRTFILRPRSDAPVATVRQLVFSKGQDGQLRLYAAGDDKVVYRWGVEELPNDQVSLKLEDKIYWPVGHDVRGVIYALAVRSTNTGDLVAFGGVGVKSGQVYVVSTDKPDAAQVLIHPDVCAQERVLSLAFQPQGSLLAVGYSGRPMQHDAKVLVYDLLGKPDLETKVLNTGLDLVQSVNFSPDGSQLVVAGSYEGNAWVQDWDVQRTKRKDQRHVKDGVTALVWNDSGWIAGTQNGIESPAGGRQMAGTEITAMSRIPRRKALLVAVSKREPGAGRRTGRVRLWQADEDKAELDNDSFVEPITAVAASPDGQYIAASGIAESNGAPPGVQIRVWRLRDGRLAQAPRPETNLTLGGPICNVRIVRGRPEAAGLAEPVSVAFTWGPYDRSHYSNQLPPPPLHMRFSLLDKRLEDYRGETPARDWRFVLSNVDRCRFKLSRGSEQCGPFPAWRSVQPSACVRFKKRLAAGADLDLAAIGYPGGILVWDLKQLDDEQGKRGIRRCFYGHASRVTCLDVDSPTDARWLVSGSDDGTISAWSLEGLERNGRELGVEFGEAQGRLVVSRDPDKTAPGWEAGFSRDQRVVQVQVVGQQIFTDPRQCRAILEHPIPGDELLVTMEKGGKKSRLYTSVSRDPLWTLYPQRDESWAIWTPQLYFDASDETTKSSRLQWHLNFPTGYELEGGTCEPFEEELPDVVSGEHYAAQYGDRARITYLLREREPIPCGDLPCVPQMRITLSDDRKHVELKAATHDGSPVAEVELRLNGYKLGAQRGDRIRVPLEPRLLRSDANRIIGAATVGTHRFLKSRTYTGPGGLRPARPERRLLYLGVGVNTLDHGADLRKLKALGDLQFPETDVTAVGEALQRAARQAATRRPPWSKTLVASRAAPTKANILGALDELANEANPDDFAVIMLAGHAVLADKNDRTKEILIIAQDTDATTNGKDVDRQTAVTGTELAERLSRLACRSLLVLDTCHSEAAGIDLQLQGLPGYQELGPVILTACGRDESAQEIKDIGHGVFTAAILEALTGERHRKLGGGTVERERRDRDGDGWISVYDLCHYVQARTPEMVRILLRGADVVHTPQVLESRTFKDWDQVRLSAVP